jgi:XRE family aerobic/anaerobic benzoate catabolism transcriptional regulator
MRMHYSAFDPIMQLPSPAAITPARRPRTREQRRTLLLRALGGTLRACRSEAGLTLRALAERAHVSERFLVQLETGEANISIARLADVADALGTTAATLLATAQTKASPRKVAVIALLGVRGAGKSSIGELLARRLKVPLVELDALVAREAGMSLTTIFEMHGEAYFRRLERQALRRILDLGTPCVLATGGSLVTDAETYALLRRRAVTVWLRAEARDHWARVVAQGDVRPMKDRANAMSELKALLRTRKALYAMAEHEVETSGVSVEEATRRVLEAMKGTS